MNQTINGTPGCLIESPPQDPAIPSCGSEKWWDLEKWLPMDLIREHTKTDDVPQVTDEQINLYRKASVESAEQYTGYLLEGQRPITQSIAVGRRRRHRHSYQFTLRYPVSDGVVFIYGGHLKNAITLRIEPNTTKIVVPVDRYCLDLTPCCDPCRPPSLVNDGLLAMFRAGYSSCDEIPAGIRLGCLKFIAWCIMHAGDEILTVRNREAGERSVLSGTNNIPWASGALELWRQYDPEAI